MHAAEVGRAAPAHSSAAAEVRAATAHASAAAEMRAAAHGVRRPAAAGTTPAAASPGRRVSGAGDCGKYGNKGEEFDCRHGTTDSVLTVALADDIGDLRCGSTIESRITAARYQGSSDAARIDCGPALQIAARQGRGLRHIKASAASQSEDAILLRFEPIEPSSRHRLQKLAATRS
jgi:hypothetical protein